MYFLIIWQPISTNFTSAILNPTFPKFQDKKCQQSVCLALLYPPPLKFRALSPGKVLEHYWANGCVCSQPLTFFIWDFQSANVEKRCCIAMRLVTYMLYWVSHTLIFRPHDNICASIVHSSSPVLCSDLRQPPSRCEIQRLESATFSPLNSTTVLCRYTESRLAWT